MAKTTNQRAILLATFIAFGMFWKYKSKGLAGIHVSTHLQEVTDFHSSFGFRESCLSR